MGCLEKWRECAGEGVERVGGRRPPNSMLLLRGTEVPYSLTFSDGFIILANEISNKSENLLG